MAHDDLREHLLRHSTPPVTTPMEALRLMADLTAESDRLRVQALQGENDPEALAGYHRRLAYVLVHLAELAPEFRAAADTALGWWHDSDAAAIVAAVEGRTTR
ncbi:hypothetical protein [Streptomyces sp. NRRL WC-3742]|uniref:hypothetical protein n=1 Tax=Streptomyces sp. NRRL WC-3742 TaxID=1463934 RepID=UPI0004CB1609|nr:hypothetical protein [Streptomyces sp. NRRL WC-3742]